VRTWIAFWNILMKDVRNYYLKPPNISWGIIFPLSWTLMQMLRSYGDVNFAEIRRLLPGLISMSVLFGTTSMLAVTITFERRGRSFERLLLAPIPISAMVAAKLSGAVIFGMFNAFVPAILAALLVDLAGVKWGAVLGAVFLIALNSTLLGLMIAVSAREVFEAQTFSNFFRFPMLFLCGLFIPVTSLPVYLRPVSFLLPLTYGTDLLNRWILGNSMLPSELCILVLVGYAAGLFVICQYNIQRKWIL